ncbi:hypothetical protein MWN34_01105 [Ancylobacter sp. 6x-1]|uniref:Uncharacterized protein n=1 Tax=Ancylobacter crimeensis TaxID=2579147 RepID=A0ABT0D6D5_9HYPH|nr:hypothetical protein [Ancylobacter crimeensis]MCK0195504.1 hypothetical protein [Ancylobacter crimeensis]
MAVPSPAFMDAGARVERAAPAFGAGALTAAAALPAGFAAVDVGRVFVAARPACAGAVAAGACTPSVLRCALEARGFVALRAGAAAGESVRSAGAAASGRASSALMSVSAAFSGFVEWLGAGDTGAFLLLTAGLSRARRCWRCGHEKAVAMDRIIAARYGSSESGAP